MCPGSFGSGKCGLPRPFLPSLQHLNGNLPGPGSMTDFVGPGGGGDCFGSRGTLAGYPDAFEFGLWIRACDEET